MASDNKIILVTRRTRLQQLVAQYNTEGQAAFVIESRGLDFNEYRMEHANYMQAVKAVEAELRGSARVQLLEREYLPNFIFGPDDIIVVIGQDGLVANTLKYLNGQPVIAINPEPSRYDGILLPFIISDTAAIVKDVIRRSFSPKNITMAKASMNDGQELIAVNDFFIGPKFQTSARYEIRLGQTRENQSSSGIIISTGLGSTGWMRSIFAGVQGVVGNEIKPYPMGWDADYLQFAVREPFPSQTTGTTLVFGRIMQQRCMTVSSHMATNGVIFSDGMVDDFIEFNSGSVVNIGLAQKTGTLVV